MTKSTETPLHQFQSSKLSQQFWVYFRSIDKNITVVLNLTDKSTLNTNRDSPTIRYLIPKSTQLLSLNYFITNLKNSYQYQLV